MAMTVFSKTITDFTIRLFILAYNLCVLINTFYTEFFSKQKSFVDDICVINCSCRIVQQKLYTHSVSYNTKTFN